MRFWNMTADPEMPEDGVLDIDGPIVDEAWFQGDVEAKAFKKGLAGMRNVTVRINSPGGDVMAGAEIYSALREHSLNGKGRVTVVITALAASAASVVAMAGDEILISPVAYMMIHNPFTLAMGDAKELRKTAKTLDEIREGLITAYQRRTGKSRDELARMLDNETWMSATKCVEEGFADGIYGGEIRAAACAGANVMSRQTPADIAEMCARWEKYHAKAAEQPADPDAEPEEGEDPEHPEEETEPDGEAPAERDPEEDEPDEEPEEDPDAEPDEEEKRKRARAMAARARAVAEAWDGWIRAEKMLDGIQ